MAEISIGVLCSIGGVVATVGVVLGFSRAARTGELRRQARRSGRLDINSDL